MRTFLISLALFAPLACDPGDDEPSVTKPDSADGISVALSIAKLFSPTCRALIEPAMASPGLVRLCFNSVALSLMSFSSSH